MSGALSWAGAEPMRRVALRAGGVLVHWWTRVEIVRELGEISGSFMLEYLDTPRARAAFPASYSAANAARDALLALDARLDRGQAVDIEIDGELVLRGHIDDLLLDVRGDFLSASVTGRDRTGDLVDCVPDPDGPAEYRGLTLTQIASRICQPFGITVRADVDVGEPLPHFALDIGESAMSALEKAARQRAILVVSDGVGGLLLTRSGRRRGPASVTLPGNALEAQTRRSWRERWSEYHVVGQQTAGGGRRATRPAMDHTARPLTSAAPGSPPPAPPSPTGSERPAVVARGLARDPEVQRYRPILRQSRTQSGGASVQDQAAWMMRVQRGRSDQLAYTVLDWRAGEDDRLWRPNELVLVDDRYTDVLADQLVSGVAMSYDERGAMTRLQLMGPEAYDQVREGEEQPRRRVRRRQAGTASGDSSARPLTGSNGNA
ncbi:phage baseplate assembly protein [Teichococcus cervicalis]|uniref:Bacteriophage Mu P protein n=1 Tax=Pseudoroseomonas cervicalis ATCC 49957 TaxID=525371 RepID=D5RM87_9PROT|nr:hypothetical protein [Pseudoroseomonas cervicalis]EFH11580.1 bacteriophage Mu P protein [Pseudoroseomonas cervicalis ATCC 49957]